MNRIEINVQTGERRIVSLTAEEVADLAARPPEPPPVIACTPWQMRKALNAAGLRAAVEAAVAGADQTTKDGWEFATEFRSDDALLLALGVALGKTPDEIRALISAASAL